MCYIHIEQPYAVPFQFWLYLWQARETIQRQHIQPVGVQVIYMPFRGPLVDFRFRLRTFRVLVAFAATCLQWTSHLRLDWMQFYSVCEIVFHGDYTFLSAISFCAWRVEFTSIPCTLNVFLFRLKSTHVFSHCSVQYRIYRWRIYIDKFRTRIPPPSANLREVQSVSAQVGGGGLDTLSNFQGSLPNLLTSCTHFR